VSRSSLFGKRNRAPGQENQKIAPSQAPQLQGQTTTCHREIPETRRIFKGKNRDPMVGGNISSLGRTCSRKEKRFQNRRQVGFRHSGGVPSTRNRHKFKSFEFAGKGLRVRRTREKIRIRENGPHPVQTVREQSDRGDPLCRGGHSGKTPGLRKSRLGVVQRELH